MQILQRTGMHRTWRTAGLLVAGVLALLSGGPPVLAQPAGTAPAALAMPESPLELVLLVAGQTDSTARRQAARRMLEINSPDAIKAILTLFESRNNEAAKVAVCEAIAELKSEEPAFIAPLLGLLEGTEPALRKAAAGALAIYRDATVVDRLRGFQQRQEIAFLQESHAALMKALYERTAETDRPALLVAWLKQPLAAVERLTAIEIVHQALRKGTTPDTTVLEQLRSMTSDPDPGIRQRLVLVLRDRGLREDAARIEQMLGVEQPSAVREAAYSGLGLLGDPATIPTVIRGLADPNDAVAAEAATALGRLAETRPNTARDPAAILAADALLARAEQPIETPKLRERITDAMGRVADPRFLPILVQHAGSEESTPATRQAAVRGIGQIGDRSQIPAVLQRLNDTDAGVREAAAEAVGRLGSQPDHLRALRTRLDPKAESSQAVQNRAWEAYSLMFINLPPGEQKVVLESWSGSDSGTVGRRIDLLTALEKQYSTSRSDPAQIAAIREQLGDALIAASRPAEASVVLSRAVDGSADASGDRTRVLLKLIDAHLQTPAWDKAIAAAAELQSPSLRQTAAERLVQFAEATARNDAPGTIAFLDKLRQSVPDQFGQPWAERFNAIRRGLPSGTRPASVPSRT